MMQKHPDRHTTWRFLFSVFLLCMAVLPLTACGKTDHAETSSAGKIPETDNTGREEKEQIRIGFVVKENGRDYWIRMKKAAEQYCIENGAELIYLAGTENAVAAEQINEVDQLIEEKADAICISPVSDEMVYAALQRAHDKKIPIFAIDTDTAYENTAAYIGTDNRAAAKEGAEYAAGIIGSGGTAVILRGTLGDSVHDVRTEGITEGLTEQGLTICRSLCTTPEETGNAVQTILQMYPGLDLLITTEDEITYAAWKRVLALGNTSVRLYGFDGTKEVAGLIAEKEQVIGTTAQFPEETGVKSIRTVLDFLEHGETKETINTSYEIVTPETAAEYAARIPEETEE